MTTITFNGQRYGCRDNETALETFLRNGVNVPFSCKNGVCHACMLRSTDGSPPENSQKGIKRQLAHKDYFLSCKCKPGRDMKMALPKPSDILTRAILAEKKLISDDVCRLLIEPATQVYYHAGQFINLHGPDEIIRSYSLASVPNQDYYLELQIKRVENGQMSNWLIDEFNAGDEIEFHGPLGDCYFKPESSEQSILLISTGTGLAPHIGIVRDALNSGHQGAMHLYHGSENEQGHYLRKELAELASAHPNFKYYLCADTLSNAAHDVLAGQASRIAFDSHQNLAQWLLYLSGNPEMVSSAKLLATKAGIKPVNLYADPFEYLPDEDEDTHKVDKPEVQESVSVVKEQRKFPDPDPEMWAALDSGRLMTKILTEFYDKVFKDDLLSPYFAGVTKQRLIEKVYNFHYQMFTGEKVYFGERPRNSHHWMVIPEETFIHREKIMENTLRKHGLAEHLIQRWMDYELLYKDDIVKPKPINKILFGEEVPYEGFDTLVMEFSSLCDSCQGEINIGDEVRYHIRMGTTYCPSCSKSEIKD